MKKKANRLDAIKMIISSKEVGSQEELLQELNREGFELTQATLSRDLKQLKVAKAASMNGKYVYGCRTTLCINAPPIRVPAKCCEVTDSFPCNFQATSPLSAPARVTPAVWLTISTTMNSAKYWEPLPAMILSCWCCVKELRQARFASFCHSSFRTLNNYTYLYI